MSGVILGSNNITINGKIIETGNYIGLTQIESVIPKIIEIIQYPTTFSSPLSNEQSWNDNEYTIIVKGSDAPLVNFTGVDKMFDNVINDNEKAYHSFKLYSNSSPFQHIGSTIFRGNSGVAIFVDLGRSIIPTYMSLAPREIDAGSNNMLLGAPGRFKIYASNVSQDWTNAASTTWVLIHNQTSTLSYSYRTYTNFNLNSNSSPTTSYRYYVIVTTHLTGSYEYLMIGQWQIYGKGILEPDYSLSLIAHYAFDSPHGLYDSSGKLHNLSAFNSLFDTTKKISGSSSAFVNGIMESYLQFPTSLTDQMYNINNTNGISFSCWYNLDHSSSSQWAPLFEFSNTITDTTTTKRFGITKDDNNNGIYLGMKRGDNTYSVVNAIGQGTLDNTWHHVVWCIDTIGNWSVYIDGKLQSGYTTFNLPQKIGNTTFDFSYIFKNNYGTTNGNIDDLRIYNRVLYPREVSSLFFIKDIYPYHKSINDDYKYIPFINNGLNQTEYSINFPEETECDILIVGGGGGGGADRAGGGGGGGVIFKHNILLNGIYTILVGRGGDSSIVDNSPGKNGVNSSFGSHIALGGGGGGSEQSQPVAGGSGGGTSYVTTIGGNALQPSSSSGGFGNLGGRARNDAAGVNRGGGGGGGAGENGFPSLSTTVGGKGGDGLSGVGSIDFKTFFGLESNSSIGEYISSENKIYFGGGGGSGECLDGTITPSPHGIGGKGGGSDGKNVNQIIENPLDNSGGGGGGGGTPQRPGGQSHIGSSGSSGIVILRYRTSLSNDELIKRSSEEDRNAIDYMSQSLTYFAIDKDIRENTIWHKTSSIAKIPAYKLKTIAIMSYMFLERSEKYKFNISLGIKSTSIIYMNSTFSLGHEVKIKHSGFNIFEIEKGNEHGGFFMFLYKCDILLNTEELINFKIIDEISGTNIYDYLYGGSRLHTEHKNIMSNTSGNKFARVLFKNNTEKSMKIISNYLDDTQDFYRTDEYNTIIEDKNSEITALNSSRTASLDLLDVRFTDVIYTLDNINYSDPKLFNSKPPTLKINPKPSDIFSNFSEIDYITYEKIEDINDRTPTIIGDIGSNPTTNFKTPNYSKRSIYVLRE